MILSQLISQCLVKNDCSNVANLEIDMVTQYVRDVKPGYLFICIKNTKYDGHDFIEEALLQGAVAIVVDTLPDNKKSGPFVLVSDTTKSLAQIAAKFYNYPSRDITFIGITGTNGKTTTSYLINEILAQTGLRSGLIGTLYNKIINTYLPTPNTTPHTVQLQKLLSQMAEANVSHCTMEVSSHGLKQERVLGIDFNVAVFTNFTQDHLDFHSSMEDYFESKSLLFSRLGNGATSDIKAAVINIDDPYASKLIPITSANVYTYGCKGSGDIQANEIVISNTGTRFCLSVFDQQWLVSTKMIGLFNVYNCLAAFGACFSIGIRPEEIIKVIESISGVRGRFESVVNTKGVTAIVDYAHTPDGLINVLTTAKVLSKGNLYCVIGCGGDRDVSKRPKMAEVAIQYSTHAIFTSDNPRTEEPLSIINQMIDNISGNNYEIEVDRQTAIEKALELAEIGDVVLVAGKGHETQQIIGNETFHFDDREVIENFKKA